ncbi:hypothetical protein MKX03_017420 [Papaver bracteatum]|nr:hypothetical protein MKX03_017420 [Papaver bracteatum]
MLCIRELVYVTGPEFGKYMPMFYKYLEMGLQNVRDFQVFAVSVEVVGDICLALDDKILPFCDGIMSHLLTDLSSTGVMHPSMTPLIFSCLGDIGIAIGKHFEKYLPYAMPMIQVDSEICAEMDTANEKMMNYSDQLRCGIFDAYSGILQGLNKSKLDLMLPYAECVSKAAVAALGALAHTLGTNVKLLLFMERALYVDFLRVCSDSDDYKMKEITAWTQRMIKCVFVCEG